MTSLMKITFDSNMIFLVENFESDRFCLWVFDILIKIFYGEYFTSIWIKKSNELLNYIVVF